MKTNYGTTIEMSKNDEEKDETNSNNNDNNSSSGAGNCDSGRGNIKKLSIITMLSIERISLNLTDCCNIDSFPFLFILFLMIFGFIEGFILKDKFD